MNTITPQQQAAVQKALGDNPDLLQMVIGTAQQKSAELEERGVGFKANEEPTLKTIAAQMASIQAQLKAVKLPSNEKPAPKDEDEDEDTEEMDKSRKAAGDMSLLPALIEQSIKAAVAPLQAEVAALKKDLGTMQGSSLDPLLADYLSAGKGLNDPAGNDPYAFAGKMMMGATPVGK